MIKRALTAIALAGTVVLAVPAVANADTRSAAPVTSGAPADLGLGSLLGGSGLLAPNSLLGSVAGKQDSVLSNLVQPNNGDILKTLGTGLSSLTSDCDTILGPLTGARSGILTTSLLSQGKLLGNLTDYQSGTLRDLTYPAFVGNCQGVSAGG